jgi:D,D-heptose 1,7-bisphosphate phosphatase
VLHRDVLHRAGSQGSLEQGVLAPPLASGQAERTRAPGWVADISVPEKLARARAELPRRLRRRALFVDRDGVLNVDRGHVGTQDRWEWVPGALDAVRRATECGWHVFIVTNQSGVARGYYDEATVQRLLGWVAEQVRLHGGTIDDARYCPYHPDGVVPQYRRASDWRKPAPGMLLDLVRAWELEATRCVMVGDKAADMEAAAAAGVRGELFRGGDLAAFIAPILAREATA